MVRVRLLQSGDRRVAVVTSLPVLDHLLTLFARAGGFDLELESAPADSPDQEVELVAEALGRAVRGLIEGGERPRVGAAFAPAEEALAQVVLESASSPLVVTNVDLTDAHAGGLRTDLVARFLEGFARAACLTLHVRLVDGDDPQHVLEAIFKALGLALAHASSKQRGE